MNLHTLSPTLTTYAASFSPHPRTKVGAVLVQNFEASDSSPIPGTMFMGRNHPRDGVWVHAEVDAIEWAETCLFDTQGSTLLVNWFPCLRCAHAIVKAGVKAVYYHAGNADKRWDDPDYDFPASREYLEGAGVELVPF